jgi:hypothetical protein
VGDVAVLVSDGQSDLDHLRLLHVPLHQEVLALLLRVVTLVQLAPCGDDAWKLCVLRGGVRTMAMTLKRSDSFMSFFISSWKLVAQTSWMCVSGMLRISCVMAGSSPYESHSASVSQLFFCI